MATYTAVSTADLYCGTSTTTTSSTTISPSITWEPDCITTTTVPYYPTPATTITSSIHLITEEKIKEYTDKVDQHVDQLEEDIQFFNEKREEDEKKIDDLIGQLANANFRLGEKDTQIKNLEHEVSNLKGLVGWLEDTILKIQEKMEHDKEICQETNPG